MGLDQKFLELCDAVIQVLSEQALDELDGKGVPKEPPRYQWMDGMGQPWPQEGGIYYPFSREEQSHAGVQHLRRHKKGLHKRNR